MAVFVSVNSNLHLHNTKPERSFSTMTVVVSYGTSNLAYFRTLQKLGLYHHAARVFISSLKF